MSKADSNASLASGGSSSTGKMRVMYDAFHDRADAFATMGITSAKLGNDSEALVFFEQALDAYKTCHGPLHPTIATCYTNIGHCYNNMKNYEVALMKYQESLRISKTLFGDTHPSFSVIYKNIGNVYFSMSMFEEAMKMYELSYAISKDPKVLVIIVKCQRKLYGSFCCSG